MKNQKGYAFPMLVIWIIFILMGVGGWIANIVKLVSCDWVLSAEEVLRVVGIFVAPLGAILGYIGHF